MFGYKYYVDFAFFDTQWRSLAMWIEYLKHWSCLVIFLCARVGHTNSSKIHIKSNLIIRKASVQRGKLLERAPTRRELEKDAKRTPIQLEASLINNVCKTRKHFVSQKTDRLTWKFHWLCPTAVTMLKTRASSYSSSGLENAKARAFLTFLVFGNPSGWKKYCFLKSYKQKRYEFNVMPNDHQR